MISSKYRAKSAMFPGRRLLAAPFPTYLPCQAQSTANRPRMTTGMGPGIDSAGRFRGKYTAGGEAVLSGDLPGGPQNTGSGRAGKIIGQGTFLQPVIQRGFVVMSSGVLSAGLPLTAPTGFGC